MPADRAKGVHLYVHTHIYVCMGRGAYERASGRAGSKNNGQQIKIIARAQPWGPQTVGPSPIVKRQKIF